MAPPRAEREIAMTEPAKFFDDVVVEYQGKLDHFVATATAAIEPIFDASLDGYVVEAAFDEEPDPAWVTVTFKIPTR